jgi:hypothetical protein
MMIATPVANQPMGSARLVGHSVGQRGRSARTVPHRVVEEQQRDACRQQCDEVGDDERAAAVVIRDIGEAPDVAEADRRADGREDERAIGRRRPPSGVMTWVDMMSFPDRPRISRDRMLRPCRSFVRENGTDRCEVRNGEKGLSSSSLHCLLPLYCESSVQMCRASREVHNSLSIECAETAKTARPGRLGRRDYLALQHRQPHDRRTAPRQRRSGGDLRLRCHGAGRSRTSAICGRPRSSTPCGAGCSTAAIG